MPEIKIDFKVTGAGGFDKLKQEYERLAAEINRGARNYSTNSASQNKFIEDEIKLIQKKAELERNAFEQKKKQIQELEQEYRRRANSGENINSLDSEFNKRNRDLLKGTGYRKVDTFLSGTESKVQGFEKLSEKYSSYTDELKAFFREFLMQDAVQAKELAEAILSSENADPAKKAAAQQFLDFQKKKDRDDGDVFGKVLSIKNALDAIGYAKQFANSSNGFDMLKPAGGLGGQLLGGGLGAGVGAIFGGPAGATLGMQIGAQLGSSIGDGIGEYLQRKGQILNDIQSQFLKGRAMSGTSNDSVMQLDEAGYSYDQFAAIRNRASTSMGRSAPNEVATRIAYLERGFNVSADLSSSLLETMRSNKGGSLGVEQTVLGLSNLLGGDRTFLPELTQRFNTFTKEFLKGQNSIKDGTVASIISSFDKIGGQFAMKDFRSEQNIMSIQNSLANPGSDNMKAISFAALRRMNPNMGIADILTEREKGLGSKGYLQAMLQNIEQIGGGEDMMRMNIGGMFGLSGAASKTLYDNRFSLMSGKMSYDNLKELNPDEFLKSEAEASTTVLDKSTAAIKNGVIEGFIESAGEIANAFEKALTQVIGTKIVVNQNGQTQVMFSNTNTPKSSPALINYSKVSGGYIPLW